MTVNPYTNKKHYFKFIAQYSDANMPVIWECSKSETTEVYAIDLLTFIQLRVI